MQFYNYLTHIVLHENLSKQIKIIYYFQRYIIDVDDL